MRLQDLRGTVFSGQVGEPSADLVGWISDRQSETAQKCRDIEMGVLKQCLEATGQSEALLSWTNEVSNFRQDNTYFLASQGRWLLTCTTEVDSGTLETSLTFTVNTERYPQLTDILRELKNAKP